MADLWLDPFAGISGDMFLGVLVDLGWPIADLQRLVRDLKLPGVRVSARRVKRGALRATAVRVRTAEHHPPHRGYNELRRLLAKARLSTAVREQALNVLERIARAEGRLHGLPWTRVHFHELGAVDTLVDVAGVCAGLEALGVTAVSVTAVNVGRGLVRTAHGVMPVPAPATLELLKGFPLVVQGPEAEMTTPTGAALVAVLASPADPGTASWTPQRIGYGAGSRTWPDFPNVLRAALPEKSPGPDRVVTEEIHTLVTQVDDVTPQTLGYVLERILAAGALDASLTPVLMKKGRPGHRIEVLCRAGQMRALAGLLFRETGTLGIRLDRMSRWVLDREIRPVIQAGRRMRFKLADLPEGKRRPRVEYEDARRAALATGRPLRSVVRSAQKKFKERA